MSSLFDEMMEESLEKNKIIADLEAKLAENEIFYKREINRRDTKLRNIKQQLAEKDNEIMELASKLDLLESEKENLFRTLEEANEETQDKISFAGEQLEKVKELLYPELRFDYSLYLRAMHEIDNQIEQLKEMPNEK